MDREWQKLEPRQMCMTAVVQGSRIELFDPLGVEVVDGQVTDE